MLILLLLHFIPNCLELPELGVLEALAYTKNLD